MGTETNREGAYIIEGVPDGNYLLRVSYVGYEPKEIAITIQPGKTTSLPNIVLRSSEEQLEEVIIQGNGNSNKYDRVKSTYVSKLPLKNIGWLGVPSRIPPTIATGISLPTGCIK